MYSKKTARHQSSRKAVSQRKVSHASATLEDNRTETVQRQPNKTGLPDNLKSGMENISGMSLDHVRVHYNSAKPATVQAHAYAQGSDIHLASGQEKHLPHELGHVVQQAQGRVSATTSVAGMAVNDSPALEHEADVLGGRAVQLKEIDSSRGNESLKAPSVSKLNVLQGYFMNGMVKGTKKDMEDMFERVKASGVNLKDRQEEFDDLNQDEMDNGQLFDYLLSTTTDKKKAGWIAAMAHQAGVIPSRFSTALNSVGEEFAKSKKPSLRLDLEKIKAHEAEHESKGGEPVSPRHRSRLIQIPNLVALLTSAFAKNKLLKNFDFILGGGSALTLKHPDDGRLGRPSDNMRDIDMDFQLKKGADPKYAPKDDSGISGVMEQIGLVITSLGAISKTLSVDNPTVTMGSTIIFKSRDLEYSFHYIDGKAEKYWEQKKWNPPMPVGFQ
ncbi:DUF4157 domain-containing protein [Erwinia mallotivora]|uniref:eCIS core domain-containing protein n=1 Tax=Erwinia mallotivora TaxID=69222 RepID=A0A014N698_9GAMM|nr:DUF4157 domain-containing protein [Erwinia mallotivora]EXU74938.1 hypothetical protein BG55_14575 [Erwinia mallotivora]